jgi:transcriptional regulator with XRE-family HTH domain
MEMSYHYRESGLDNVVIHGIAMETDDRGDRIVSIPNVAGLHRLLVGVFLRQKRGLAPKEIRFLRTEMGMTQMELGEKLHKDHQSIGRWERGEIAIDPLADLAIRLLASEILEVSLESPITEVTNWCVHSATSERIEIDGTNPNNYRVRSLAA